MRRLGVAILIVVIVAGGFWLLLDRPWDIETYRSADDHTILVTTSSGWLDWTRVTSVEETPTSVVINMRSFRLPLPGTGGLATEYTVTLHEALGDRRVVDGSTGLPVMKRPE